MVSSSLSWTSRWFISLLFLSLLISSAESTVSRSAIPLPKDALPSSISNHQGQQSFDTDLSTDHASHAADGKQTCRGVPWHGLAETTNQPISPRTSCISLSRSVRQQRVKSACICMMIFIQQGRSGQLRAKVEVRSIRPIGRQDRYYTSRAWTPGSPAGPVRGRTVAAAKHWRCMGWLTGELVAGVALYLSWSDRRSV